MKPFAIALLFMTLPSLAQDKAASWTIRAAALDIVGEHHTLWLRAGPGKPPVKIPLNIHTFSRSIKFNGPARVAFHASEADASAEEPPPPLASATLRAKSSLLVFVPGKDRKTYRARAIAEGDFPFGSFRLVNFSKSVVRAEVGKRAAVLKPGAARTFAYRKSQDAIAIRFLVDTAGAKPRVIRQSSWSISPDQRELVFFLPHPVNGMVRARHFVDTRDESAEPGG